MYFTLVFHVSLFELSFSTLSDFFFFVFSSFFFFVCVSDMLFSASHFTCRDFLLGQISCFIYLFILVFSVACVRETTKIKMPRLLSRFLFKAPPCCPTSATQITSARDTLAPEQEADSIPKKRQPPSAQVWAVVDIFAVVLTFYERGGADTRVCTPRSLAETFSNPDVPVTKLPTTELTSRVLRLLLRGDSLGHATPSLRFPPATVRTDEGSAHTSNKAVQARFTAELRRLIAGHRAVASLLHRRAAEQVVGDTQVKPSLACVLMEAAAAEADNPGTIGGEPFSFALPARDSAVNTAVFGRPTPISSVCLVESFTQVLSTNLYTISAFLEAFQDDSGSPPQPGLCEYSASAERLKAFLLPHLFYLVTLTLDVADAALLFPSEQPATFAASPATAASRTSFLLRVKQQEGSHVLSCLLQMRGVPRCVSSLPFHPRVGCESIDDTAVTASRWVATHHLLRRLRPLLFQGLSRYPCVNLYDTVREASDSAVLNESCDYTDAGLLTWMADQLDLYRGERRLTPSAARTPMTEGALAASEFAFSTEFLRSSPSCVVHESLACACLVELLRLVTKQFRRIAVTTTEPAAMTGETEERDSPRSPGETGRRSSIFGRDSGMTVALVRVAEYASALGPSVTGLQESDVWEHLPPALREAVNNLQMELHVVEEWI